MKKKEKSTRVTAKMKAKARKTIKEPTFGLDQAFQSAADSRTTIQTTINWYNQYFDTQQSKEWALEWIKESTELCDKYKAFKAVPADWIGNKGFVCRMIANGFQLDERSRASLVSAFHNNLKMLPKEENPSTDTPIKVARLKLKEDPFWAALIDVEDTIIESGGKPDTRCEKWLFFESKLNSLPKMEKKRAKNLIKQHKDQLVADVNYLGETALHRKIEVSRRIIKSFIYYYDKWINTD